MAAIALCYNRLIIFLSTNTTEYFPTEYFPTEYFPTGYKLEIALAIPYFVVYNLPLDLFHFLATSQVVHSSSYFIM